MVKKLASSSLKTSRTPAAPTPLPCSPHNNPDNYVEREHNRRVRVTCRVCGKFVGYKMETKGKKQ